jgi:hypothetical protein
MWVRKDGSTGRAAMALIEAGEIMLGGRAGALRLLG